jgi:hypothetical protein
MRARNNQQRQEGQSPKMKWFKREKRSLDVKLNTGTIQHTHTVEFLPKPVPVRITFTVRNDSGQEWHLFGGEINGRAIVPVNFPLSFLTDRPVDSAKQVSIHGRLDY